MRQPSSQSRSPICIVDGDEPSRALMATALRRAGYATSETATAEDALAAAAEEQPRMVVLEVCLDGMSGYEACREFRDRFGDQLPIVFVSADRSEVQDRVAGFLVGGDEFLAKPFAVDEFVARVRRLLERAEGRAIFDSALTTREVEVLSLVAEGLDGNAIARRLFISPKTVGTHIERIFRKLGVHSRAEAVAFAYEHGLLPVLRERGRR